MTGNRSAFKRVGLAILALIMMVCGLAFTTPALAGGNGYGFSPQRYQSGYQYGNGIFFAPYSFTVFSEPKAGAEPIGTFQWSHQTAGNNIDWSEPNGDRHAVYADHTFFCFFPQLDVAMMAVVSDTEDGWVEVVYDQAQRKTGWVQTKNLAPETESEVSSQGPSDRSNSKLQTQKSQTSNTSEPVHFGVYQTWLEFMKLNAKASGIYWLSGVKEYNRSIRSSDTDEAKLIPVTIIRDLKVKHLRGNWLLVEVLDFERNTPIGWVRWRDDNGNLMLFPNLSGKHMPIVTTAY